MHPWSDLNSVCWYTASMKVSIILDDEEAYAIFLQCLDGGEVTTKRGSIVLDRLWEKKTKRTRTGWQGTGLKPAPVLYVLGVFPRFLGKSWRMAAL